jgi:hypothetical protein
MYTYMQVVNVLVQLLMECATIVTSKKFDHCDRKLWHGSINDEILKHFRSLLPWIVGQIKTRSTGIMSRIITWYKFGDDPTTGAFALFGSTCPRSPCRHLFMSGGMPIPSDLSAFPLANSCGNGTYVFEISWVCVSHLEIVILVA